MGAELRTFVFLHSCNLKTKTHFFYFINLNFNPINFLALQSPCAYFKTDGIGYMIVILSVMLFVVVVVFVANLQYI